MDERNIYLTNIDIEDVLTDYLKEFNLSGSVKSIEMDIRNAVGYTTSAPVYAKLSSPNYNAAAMDGIAVVSAKTYMANEANPVALEIGSDFAYVNTGNIIKEPFDGVIMIEDVSITDESHVRIIEPASPWQHVRPVGEDIVAGEMILPENHEIRPMDVGAVLSGGVVTIKVYEKIKVGIIPTGSEITDEYSYLQKGKIFDTNSWTFKSLVEKYGAECHRVSPVPDEYELIKSTVSKMVNECHMVVINAGSSAGSKDYTAKIIKDLGAVFIHGIAIKPGKPTILGVVRGKPVIGLPGYPCSAYVVFEEIVMHVIRSLQGKSAIAAPAEICEAVVSRRIVSSLKYREYIRVKLGKVGQKLIATPLNRGAGVTMALVRSDGLLIVPKSSEGFEAGQKVNVFLTNHMDKIDRTIVSIGSHDLIMDILGSILAKKYGFYISSAHVGSMGGIMSLKRDETHISPIHLLDEATGVYNTSYIDRYLKDEGITLVKGVKRVQGIITKKGNPKSIQSVEDLSREGITFVNRQKGSGTRILADYLFKAKNVDVKSIVGYEREMTTHMAVAAAIDGGMADAGLGVYSAAHVLGLDFIPIGDEDYDFAVPEKYMESPMLKGFFEILHCAEFKVELEKLGGYTV